MNSFQKTIIFLLVIIVLQSLAFTAFAVRFILPEKTDDIRLVKEMPIPFATSYTIDSLLNRVTRSTLSRLTNDKSAYNLEWNQFEADSGETIVEVHGTVEDYKVQEQMVKDLGKILKLKENQISDFSFHIQFMKTYTSKVESFFAEFLPSIFSSDKGQYSYSVSFQTFGALKESKDQYHEVLTSLAKYLREAY